MKTDARFVGGEGKRAFGPYSALVHDAIKRPGNVKTVPFDDFAFLAETLLWDRSFFLNSSASQ